MGLFSLQEGSIITLPLSHCGRRSLVPNQKIDGSWYFGGVAVCRGGPKLSHLFFADDSLIF